MILFLAGTSDARELAIEIQQAGFQVLATIVTETAAKSLQEAGILTQIGRLTAADMTLLINEKGFQAVVDASHPFAEEASKNALQGAKEANVPYIRYERESQRFQDEKLIMVSDYAEAAKLAATKRGVIMLTTGSKTLEIFAEELVGLENTRVIARMLPRIDNMEKCAQLGIEQKNIVAIQGPFSKELNKALYNQYEVTLMITKESGKVGSVDEKLEAALECGIETIMISRPNVDYQNVHSSFDFVIADLNKQLHEK
ncbi:precorrin-6A reductase [Peribacillus cavernae]|uniref:Precorrin-6A reductase n=1 Tax=Peribacillus cavernae TaxID=1674310 RepID=A0A433HQM4_9BACI|nr:precorrin-6A reductase [Peribacillus cavernae]MDQ0216921.1 precorrin-6A/cobalt-precorrin-6A reductase [Peribacillus cavernae]RUQ30585.1 precorrin-6A reductase [Peribacillus cavernae]